MLGVKRIQYEFQLAAALFHHFKKPVMIVEGKMQYLFDETGRRYLDVSLAFSTTANSLHRQTSLK